MNVTNIEARTAQGLRKADTKNVDDLSIDVQATVMSSDTFYKALFRCLLHRNLIGPFVNAIGIPAIALLKIDKVAHASCIGERTFSAIMRVVAWLTYQYRVKPDDFEEEKTRILGPSQDAMLSKEVNALLAALAKAKFVLRLMDADHSSKVDASVPTLCYKVSHGMTYGWMDVNGDVHMIDKDAVMEMEGELECFKSLHLVFDSRALQELCTTMVPMFETEARDKLTSSIDTLARLRLATEKVVVYIRSATEDVAVETVRQMETKEKLHMAKIETRALDEAFKTASSAIAKKKAALDKALSTLKTLDGKLNNTEMDAVRVKERQSKVEARIKECMELVAACEARRVIYESKASECEDMRLSMEVSLHDAEAKLRAVEDEMFATEGKLFAAEEKLLEMRASLVAKSKEHGDISRQVIAAGEAMVQKRKALATISLANDALDAQIEMSNTAAEVMKSMAKSAVVNANIMEAKLDAARRKAEEGREAIMRLRDQTMSWMRNVMDAFDKGTDVSNVITFGGDASVGKQ